MQRHCGELSMRGRQRLHSAQPVIPVIPELVSMVQDLRGLLLVQATMCPVVVSIAMEARRLQQLRYGRSGLRIIMAVTRGLVAVCGRQLIHVHMPSSEAGPALPIIGRTGLLNLPLAVQPAEQGPVRVVARLVTVLLEPTQQAVHISKYK